MLDKMTGNAPSARRSLRREEMRRFGTELEWLFDPSLIPDGALNYLGDRDPIFSDPFLNLSSWMTDSFARWSEEGHRRLSFGDTFEKYELTNEERVKVRESFLFHSDNAYAPGISAMAEVFTIIPELATREGYREQASWLQIASAARVFGGQIARDGTEVQALVRDYIDGRVGRVADIVRFDSTKLKLDAETGITTITPISRVMALAREASDTFYKPEKPTAGCAALQAVVEGTDGRTMYDLVWDAFGDATGRLIYPNLTPPSRRSIPRQEKPQSEVATRTRLETLIEATLVRNALLDAQYQFLNFE